MLRLPPFDKIGANPVPDCVNADPTNGVAGSILNMLMFNILQYEGENATLLAGLTPSGTDLTQIAQAIARRGIWCGDLTGTGDLAVATLGVVLPPLARGMSIGAVATATNTVTNPKLRVINVGSAGAAEEYPILLSDGSGPPVGSIKPGRHYRYEFDGSGNVTISGGGIGAGAGGASPTRILYLTAGATITVQPGETRARAIGDAGGGGGGASYGNPSGGSGGGGGGGFDAYVTGLTAGQTIPCTVGAGGTAGPVAGLAQAGSGGPTSFGSYASATGGTGGYGSSGLGTSSVGIGGTGSLAAGVVGQTYAGAQGGSSYGLNNGSSVMSGYGGGSGRGTPPSAWGTVGASATGPNGNLPGGGAGASINQAPGGVGGAGLLVVALYP